MFKEIFGTKERVVMYTRKDIVKILYGKMIRGGVEIKKAVKYDLKDIPGEERDRFLKEKFMEEGIPSEEVILIIEEEGVLMRRFTMPFVDKRNRENAIKFEARKHIPFNLEEIIWNYYLFLQNSKTDQNNIDVLFYAARSIDVEEEIEFLETAGIGIVSVVPDIWGIMGLLNILPSYRKDVPAVVVRRIDENNIQLVFVKDGVPYIKKEINIAKRDVVQVIITELKMAMIYMKKVFPHIEFSQVYLSGIDVPGLGKILNKGLGLEMLEIDLRKLGIDIDEDYLILVGTLNETIRFPELWKGKRKISRRLFYYIIMLELTIAVLVATGIYWNKRGELRTVENAMKVIDYETKVSPYIKEMNFEELQKLKADYLNRMNLIKLFSKKRYKLSQLLSLTSGLLPLGCWLENITVLHSPTQGGKEVFIIRGKAFDENPFREMLLVNTFYQKLQSNELIKEHFKKITIGTLKRERVDKYIVVSFDISLTSD